MSDVNPADVTAAARPLILEEFNQDAGEPSATPDADRKSPREGLPAGYRMRADAHYVDHRVTAAVAAGELRAIEVTQDDVAVPATASSRFLDPGWHDRPGGWIAGLGAQVARAVAQQHGGDLVFLAADRRGSTIRFGFTRERPL